MKTAQISDLHWRGFQRHDEYVRMLNKLYASLDEKKPDVVVCTGDVFHTKTQNITPEIVDQLVLMFRNLARKERPLHMILGNHDGNLANEARQDAISPIIDAMRHPYIHLYKQSGVYDIGENYNLCVFSCFDKENWKNVAPSDGYINIALFHGSIAGCIMDNEWKRPTGEETLDFFKGYDFALLGDIHKRQFLASKFDIEGNSKPWIGYPGSLIQQNYGEEESKGYLIWDIRSKDDWDIEYVPLENETPYITIPWMGDVHSTINLVNELRGDKAFTKGTRVRVVTTQTLSNIETRQLFHEIREVRGCSELVYKYENVRDNLQNIQTGTLNIQKTSLRNNVGTIKHLYRDYVNKHLSKMNFTVDQLERGEDLIDGYMKRFIEADAENPARDVNWSYSVLEFSNLFRYGEGNRIDFSKYKGILGIFGPNMVGKSSVVSSLMYGLFNKTDRESLKGIELINLNKKSASAKVTINAGGQEYIITRSMSIKDKRNPKEEDKATTTLVFQKVNKDGSLGSEIDVTNENNDSRIDTDKVIRKLIGTREDCLLTSVASQYASNNFIALGPTARKAVLNKFLDVDIFEKLYKYANEDWQMLNSKTANYQTVAWDAAIAKLEWELGEFNKESESKASVLTTLRSQADEIKLWLKQHSHIPGMDQKQIRDKLVNDISTLKNKLQILQNDLSKNNTTLDQIKLQIDSETLAMVAVNLQELRTKKQELAKLLEEKRRVKVECDKQDVVWKGQQKSVKKLTIVPCGDNYPTCHFIKEAHQDKQVIQQQETVVTNMLQQLASIDELIQQLEASDASNKLEDYEKRVVRCDRLKQELKTKEETVVSLGELIKAAQENLTSKQELLSKTATIDDKIEKEILAKQVELETLIRNISRTEEKKNELLVNVGITKNKIESLKKEREECKLVLEKLQICDSVLEAFSKNGIPAVILQTQLPLINQELEKITSGLGFKVTLKTEVSSNTLDVFIENQNPKRVVETCSGAEMAMVSLAIRIALTNLSSLPKSDILIIDESFGSLDEVHVPKILQLLTVLKSHFRLIVVISHIPQIKEVADHILDIVDNGMESKVIG